jgi:hypothetical protein
MSRKRYVDISERDLNEECFELIVGYYGSLKAEVDNDFDELSLGKYAKGVLDLAYNLIFEHSQFDEEKESV